MKSLCIFTPTYNRAHTLPDLYASLKRQTSNDFKWLVVDDGSTDGTDELISSFADEGLVVIEYHWVANGGKQRAMDYAARICSEELLFTVDSDDYLVDDAVQTILNRWESVEQREDIAGIIALKGYQSDKPLHTRMPAGETFSTLKGLYKKGFKGDTSLVYRARVMREFPFDVDPDEKFIPESFMYNQIDRKYQCLLLDKVLTIVRYLPDGYSKAFPRNVIVNPKGYYRDKQLCMELADDLIDLFKSTMLFLAACQMCGRRDGISLCTNKAMGLVCFLPATMLRHFYFE